MKANLKKIKVTKICKGCKIVFEPNHSKQVFHNVACYGRWKSKQMRGSNNPNWHVNYVKCPICTSDEVVIKLGTRQLKDRIIQDYFCKECKKKFTKETTPKHKLTSHTRPTQFYKYNSKKARRHNLIKNIIKLIRKNKRGLSTRGIINGLIEEKCNGRKTIGSGYSVGGIMHRVKGKNGIIGKTTKRTNPVFTLYLYDKVMHFCHDVISFSKYLSKPKKPKRPGRPIPQPMR